jgi:1-acyl-sn-glycerol-3-phosphate acyltransferase
VLGDGFEAWRRSPLAARITAAWMEPLITSGSSIAGLEHLDAGLEAMGQGRRLMIVCNHLSYPDVNMLGHLLLRAGRPEVRALLTALAGPKAYSDPMHVATGQAELSPRELVRILRHCLGLAERVMDEGQIVVIFPEGTRSRSGRLQPFLRATSRWLSLPGVVLLPTAIWGTEAFDAEPLAPAECHARFGPLLDLETPRGAGVDRGGVVEAAREAVAALLPEGYRPVG